MKRAFITGATGFVGSHLVDLLLENGYQVKCLIRKSSNLRWLKDKNVELAEGSLNDKESLKKALNDVDYVFHLAGVLFGRNEDAFYKGNIEGTQNLLEACFESGATLKRFLHCGTQAVAGPSPTMEPIGEEAECHPLTWYGKSKLKAEQLVLSYADKFPITVVRPGAVYGPRDYAIFEVFKASLSGFNLKVGSGEKYVSFIHVEDLVKGILAAAESERSKAQVYFLVNDEFSTQDAIAKEAIKVYGKSVKTIALPLFIIRIVAFFSELFGTIFKKDVVLNHQKIIEISQERWIASNAKAKRDFNFQPKWTIADGVRMTAEWYRDQAWLKW